MRTIHHIRRGLGGAAGLALALGSIVPAAPLLAQPVASRPKPSEVMNLSIGSGQLINLKGAMTDLFVANPATADVQVRSSNQLYIFGKAAGETTVYATNKAGAVIWSATVRVGNNLTNIGQMLKLAMPDAQITATTMNGLVLLTGTVGSPSDIEEAQRLTQAYVGADMQVISRLKSAVPQQVTLQVRIAEVSKNVLKNIGVNLLTRDSTGGFMFGIAQGRPAGASFTSPNFTSTGIGSTIGGMGRLLGLDIVGSLDLAEQEGLVTTLANPNLTAMSGETASFLAGGEIPIPVSQGLGAASVEYKQYGVSLSFTPTVLSGNRVAMRVRPEVSQLDDSSAVTINGFNVPGTTTRRAETTVELGSGQSFVIGGLLSNNHSNTINKAPFLGDLPILGSLFRSNSFRHQQSELVIVVTPYLVNPVNADQVMLPTDGYHAPSDADRILNGQLFRGATGEKRPQPQATVPASVTMPAEAQAPAAQPTLGSATPLAPSVQAPAPSASLPPPAAVATAQRGSAVAPGFSFN